MNYFKLLLFAAVTAALFAGCVKVPPSERGTSGLIPANYYDIEDFKNIKHYVFSCDYSKVKASGEKARPYCVRVCGDNTSCLGANADNYFSTYMPFNFQYLPVIAYDYALNSFAFFERNGESLEQKAFNNAFTNNPSNSNVKTPAFAANLSFQKFTPYSFALSGGEKGRYNIFIAASDVLLRNKIYPTFKLLSLKEPTEGSRKNSLSKYSIEYGINPSAFLTDYSSDKISYLTGAPLYENAKYNIESLIKYFEGISKGAKSIDFKTSGAPTFSELARPFVFEDKIIAYWSNKGVELAPAVNKDAGFLNEYLPYYSLNKIEIIKKSPNGTETVMHIYDSEAIASLLAGSSPAAGFSFNGFKEEGDVIALRFTHSANPPAFIDMGVLRSINTGIRDMYASLGTAMVSDLNVGKYYDFQEIPLDCIKKLNASEVLKKAGKTPEQIKMFTGPLKDDKSVCDPREIFMTSIILTEYAR